MRPFVLWLTMVFIASVYPIETRPLRFDHADKIVHMAIYAVTCLLFWTAFRKRAGRHALMVAVAFATVYGLLMEVAQHITGYRHFSLADGAANFAGATLAAVIIWFKLRAANRNKES